MWWWILGIGLFVLLFGGGMFLYYSAAPGVAQRELERQAESDLRQEMAYRAAQKKAANKLLREHGETP